jgi:hypothetical protein
LDTGYDDVLSLTLGMQKKRIYEENVVAEQIASAGGVISAGGTAGKDGESGSGNSSSGNSDQNSGPKYAKHGGKVVHSTLKKPTTIKGGGALGGVNSSSLGNPGIGILLKSDLGFNNIGIIL